MKTIRHGNEFWRLHDDGCITRPGIFSTPSGKWRVVGAVRRNNFGHIVGRFTLEDILRGGIQWKHKNGAQRVFVQDFDHGSIREWRTPHSI
jgi:hypothetical protein